MKSLYMIVVAICLLAGLAVDVPAQTVSVVDVWWTAPTSGGEVVTYELYAVSDTLDVVASQIASAVIDAPATSAALTIPDGTPTFFRVRALNSGGFAGEFSEWSARYFYELVPSGCGRPEFQRRQ